MTVLQKSFVLSFATFMLTTVCLGQTMRAQPNHTSDEITYAGRVQGDLQYFGLNESVETWTDFDEAGNPTRIGITISETFVDHNSETLSAKLSEPHRNMNAGSYFDLELPQSKDLPFKHAYFSFHPMGHVPPGIYDMPHFDFHFYLVPNTVRKSMAPQAVARALEPVPEGYLPTTYHAASKYNNFYWPYMGTHFLSDNTDEIKITADGDVEPGPSRFDQSFIYGTFGGDVAFMEPMIASWYLETIKASEEGSRTFDLELPNRYKAAGYYPTKYRIAFAKDPMTGVGYYTVSLENMVWRDAG